jgi:hypothetical protein
MIAAMRGSRVERVLAARAGALTLAGIVFGWAAAGAQLVTESAVDTSRREFLNRVEAYVQLHRAIASGLPPLEPTSDVERVIARRKALTEGIRKARNRSTPGEIFVPSVRNYFRELIRRALMAHPREEARAILAEVPRALQVRVNQEYPAAAPLATIPPELLSDLPPLPAELEYRFLGRALILRDADANLVVDYIESAIPRI